MCGRLSMILRAVTSPTPGKRLELGGRGRVQVDQLGFLGLGLLLAFSLATFALVSVLVAWPWRDPTFRGTRPGPASGRYRGGGLVSRSWHNLAGAKRTIVKNEGTSANRIGSIYKISRPATARKLPGRVPPPIRVQSRHDGRRNSRDTPVSRLQGSGRMVKPDGVDLAPRRVSRSMPRVTCGKCSRELEYSGGDRPLFCAYCGQSLGTRARRDDRPRVVRPGRRSTIRQDPAAGGTRRSTSSPGPGRAPGRRSPSGSRGIA